MKMGFRALLLGLLGAFFLATAGSARAAFTSPTVRVTDDGTTVTIRYTVSPTDDPTAKLHFFVPTGYTARPNQPAGKTLGTVTAQGTAADLGGALLPLTGTVQARAETGTFTSAPGGTPTPLTTAATQCTGTPTHTAYWVLILQAAGQTLELPVYVDAPAAGANASGVASASIQACLPPPDVPPGTPGRASFGLKLTQVDVKLNSVFTSGGQGATRWRVLATPYTPATGRPNAAGSVEALSEPVEPPDPPRPPSAPHTGVSTKTVASAATLPSATTFNGSRSVKHSTLTSLVYRTMKQLGLPRQLAFACWNTSDWLSVLAAEGEEPEVGYSTLLGFWVGRQPRWLHLAPRVCTDVQGLLSTRRPNARRAGALATVIHETLHAYGVRNEAQTNCFAVQLVPIFGLNLGMPQGRAGYLGTLARNYVRKYAPQGYWNAVQCRDSGTWDLFEGRNLS